jgi:SAM-dependent methyltransferase
MLHDPWLNRWIPKLRETVGTRPVLEIGCGTGADTATLVDAGFSVIALDLSAAAVATTKLRVPRATVFCQDVRDPFPLGKDEAGAVVASLSLHYFSWEESLSLVQRIRESMAPNTLFLCRLNSTEDENFGAKGYPSIEPDFYLVDGQPKRFFNERAVDELFAPGWKISSKEHHTTNKYIRSKALWEVVARRQV